MPVDDDWLPGSRVEGNGWESTIHQPSDELHGAFDIARPRAAAGDLHDYWLVGQQYDGIGMAAKQPCAGAVESYDRARAVHNVMHLGLVETAVDRRRCCHGVKAR
jgi:hypothetical protein